ncbi:hypothetical protein F8M41_010911 [Gigaspora margarita]|uniref:Uncharacterized protein n=1 Tax=Gigaspora margarita TaxID=4874 RepID=A0A8H4A0X5_GIGMA|nr:hypothetical protein F8M41_010911 [Gigaspora margarita]
MEPDKKTFGLGHHYRNGVTNTNRFYGQNESEIDMDKCKALIHYQIPTDDNKDSETIVVTESKDNAPGKESYQKLVEVENAAAVKLGREEKNEESKPRKLTGIERTVTKDRSNINYEQPTELNFENKEEKIGPDELIDHKLANTNEPAEEGQVEKDKY